MKNYPLYQVEPCATFPEYLNRVGRFGDKVAVSFYDLNGTEHSCTYDELIEQVRACGRALLEMGATDCQIAIAGENSLQWLVSFLAVTSVGSTAVLVDIEQPDETIRELIRQVDTKYILVSETFQPICAPLLTDGGVEEIAVIGPDEDGSPHASFTEWLERGKNLPESEPVAISPDQAAAIIFTSGTTSRSKPVVLTHRNLTQNIVSACQFVDLMDKVFTSLPLYHSYGLNSSCLCALYEGTVLVMNGDMKTMVRDLTLSSPTTAMTVPLMVEALYKGMWTAFAKHGKDGAIRKLLNLCLFLRKLGIRIQPSTLLKAKRACFGNLELMVVGGAHLDAEICEELFAFGIQVLQGYGITECSPIISVNRNQFCRYGSVGHILPSFEVKLVDEEIWARGSCVMQGYYEDPEATAAVLSDGWFKTGDLGAFDKDGFLFIKGRIKNLIVLKNGKKISPEKIEDLILQIPLVKDVVVYGAVFGASGDDVKPAASIYPDPLQAQGMSSYEVLEHLQQEISKINAHLPIYQQILMVNVREKEFAKTASMKIKRHLLDDRGGNPSIAMPGGYHAGTDSKNRV